MRVVDKAETVHELIIDYFHRSAPDTRARMIRHYSDEVVEFARLLNMMITLLSRFIAERPQYDKERPYHPAYGLMTKSANTLGAGFELILTGYYWEPPALFRSAVEACAVAWDIVHKPERFNAWRDDKKFKSTDSISNAKEVSEVIGKLYGLQSKMNIHTGPINSSPAMFMTDKPRAQLFGLVQPGKEYTRKAEVYYALFVTFVCLQLAELTFHMYGDKLETIEILAGKGQARTRVSATHRKFKSEMVEVFRQSAEGEYE